MRERQCGWAPSTAVAIGWLLASACSGSGAGSPATSAVPQGAELAKSSRPREQHPVVSSGDAETFGRDSRAFALELYAKLAKDKDNLFFSPYSIWTALAMTYAGARGTTESEMQSALHYSLPQSALHAAFNAVDQQLAMRKDQLVPSSEPVEGDGFSLQVVNQAWGQKGFDFLGGYLDVLAVNYGAGLFLVDFGQPEPARKLINDWVAQQTHDRIQDLIPPPLDPLTKLVLTNAIYFKASWKTKFDPAKTDAGSFQAPGGARSVRMMHAVQELAYGEGVDYQAVALPYLSPDVMMLLVLPADGQFDAVSQGLDTSFFDAVRNGLSHHLVTLSLPKWSFTWDQELSPALMSLGMQAAFSAADADFSGIDGAKDLLITAVFHKAFVAVDEQGTEAAAATAVIAGTTGIPSPASITFDRPFIFAIYDQPSGQILFLGQLLDPG